MALSRGIDISHHQGNVDWRALKTRHGLTWAACKASEGRTFTDDHFARNWAGMKAAGLVRMAYHFARPESSSGASQARRFLAIVKPVRGDVLCLDLEASALSQAATNAWAREFGATLRALAPDCTTVVYAGGYSQNGSGRGLVASFDYWWYARYPWDNHTLPSWPMSIGTVSGNTTGWPRPHIWQWTSKLPPGYDANVSTLTAAQLSAGPTPAKPVQPPDGLDPAMEIEDPSNHTMTPLATALKGIWTHAWQANVKADENAEKLAELEAKVAALQGGTVTGSATVTVNLSPTEEPA